MIHNFNIFNTIKFKCTQPRLQKPWTKYTDSKFDMRIGSEFVFQASLLPVFFWRQKLSLQQKHKTHRFGWEENWWRLNVKTPISFTHAQERSAKLRLRDLVTLAKRKCVFLDNDFKTHTWPLPFGKSRILLQMTCEATKPDTFARPLLQVMFLGSTACWFDLRNTTTNLAAKSMSQFCYVWLHHPAAQPEMFMYCT